MFLDLRKQNQWGLRQNESNFSQNSYDISYLPRQACYKAFIFFTAHAVRHDWRLVFLTLGNVHQSYFVRLATGGKKKTYYRKTEQLLSLAFYQLLISHSYIQLHFSRTLEVLCEYSSSFSPLICFPALTKDHKSVLRLATVTNFPAFFYRLHIFPVYRRSHAFLRFLFHTLFALNSDWLIPLLEGQSRY